MFCVSEAYLALVVGAGQRLAGCSSTDRLQDAAGLRFGALGVPLQHLHEVSDEEVVLEGSDTFLWQDGRLATHRARQSQGLRRDVVL